MIFDIIFILVIIGVTINVICISNSIKLILCFYEGQVTMILLLFLLAEFSCSEILRSTKIIENMINPLPEALMITASLISASIVGLTLKSRIKTLRYCALSWTEFGEKDVSK